MRFLLRKGCRNKFGIWQKNLVLHFRFDIGKDHSGGAQNKNGSNFTMGLEPFLSAFAGPETSNCPSKDPRSWVPTMGFVLDSRPRSESGRDAGFKPTPDVQEMVNGLRLEPSEFSRSPCQKIPFKQTVRASEDAAELGHRVAALFRRCFGALY